MDHGLVVGNDGVLVDNFAGLDGYFAFEKTDSCFNVSDFGIAVRLALVLPDLEFVDRGFEVGCGLEVFGDGGERFKRSGCPESLRIRGVC